ncbi:MAG: alpha/beta hydrolase [Alistipes sp.]|nr:alpha/beta hydrolase [Alistipes sp.]
MKRLLVFLTLFLTGARPVAAQDYGQAFTVKIWDNATAPHSNGIDTPETVPAPNRIGNVSAAELYVFPADEAKNTGLAVVICPGGGYARLAMDYEGYNVAKWLASNGVTAAVLKYRMPAGHPEVPLEDAGRALRIMMGLEAGATGCTADKVGIAGFSAGGHLAAMTSNLAETKPAFAILFYPVITARKGLAHEGSFDNLLGAGRDAASEARYSLENRVTEQTPPTLLLLSDDDRSVPPVNSALYYEALKRHGVEASLHVYPTGGHGWGIRENFRYRDQWQAAVLDWLERRQAKNEK